jgi:hypothetical protein
MISLHPAGRFSAAVDRPFLENVKQNFGDWGVVPEMIAVIVLTVLAAAAVGAVGFGLNNMLKKRRPGSKPSSWITDPEDIEDALEKALAQRTKIELSFTQSTTGATTTCILSDLTRQALKLEAPGHLQISADWIGRRVDCMFGLLVSKQSGMVRFHIFETEILGIKRTGPETIEITLQKPEKLIIRQKRVHLRVEPPANFIMGMALWPEILDESYKPETRLKKWGRPLAKYIHGEKNPIRAVNFSAGGLRLELDPELIRKSNSNFEIGEHYFLLVDLYEPQADKKMRFWLNIKVKNRFEDFHTRKLGAGFQIVGRAELTSKGKGEIVWHDVSPDGLDSLGNWTVQRHLELFREKGVVT